MTVGRSLACSMPERQYDAVFQVVHTESCNWKIPRGVNNEVTGVHCRLLYRVHLGCKVVTVTEMLFPFIKHFFQSRLFSASFSTLSHTRATFLSSSARRFVASKARQS